jgi:signal transduction histidine kinase
MEVPELPEKVTQAFYRIAREAFNNIIVHAAATQVEVSLVEERGRVTMHIQDNGRGFDPEAIPVGHLGIRIIDERAAEIGGDLQIQSRPGHGTQITLTWSRPQNGRWDDD